MSADYNERTTVNGYEKLKAAVLKDCNDKGAW